MTAALVRQDSEVHPEGQDTEEWSTRSACRTADPELFYPLSELTAEAKEALAICDGCPVRLECLGRALDTGEQYGIWGGMTASERRALHQAAAAP